PHFLGGVSASAIRSGPWKLIEHLESGYLQLYSLHKDPGETTNLAESEVAMTSRLHQALIDWRASVSTTSLPASNQ
ncbi:MAG: sulfatase, partial [Verrucomicrobia bacterium]|nr:sulfatase [Verrucomicrobiota bacterium]